MKFGLSEEQLRQIRDVLAKHSKITEAVIFGSRAMGNYKEASDVDIALKGEVNASLAEKVKAELEENTILPFFFDIVAYPTIDNPELVKHIDEFGSSFYRAGWGETPLRELSTYVNRGISPIYVESDGIIVFNQKCIRNGSLNLELSRLTGKEKKIPDEKYLQKNDILVNSTGVGTAGRVAFFSSDIVATVDSHVTLIRIAKEKADPKFIYFFLRNMESDLEVLAEGSTGQIELGRESIKEIPIPLPGLPEQHSIAGVLSSLDDKIDILHRQNKTLEGIAAALWRKMFVEEADENWDEKSLLDVIELVGGGTPKTEVAEYWDGSIPWLSAKDVSANHGGFVFSTEKNITEAGVKNSSVSLLPKYSTVVSARGTVGKYCMLSGPMAFSQSNYGIRPKIGESFFFTYLLIVHVIDELKMAAYGSVFDTITTNTFKEQLVNIPNDAVVLSFEKTITPYFEKMFTNTEQIIGLSNQRKLLLPKLISGEVTVKA